MVKKVQVQEKKNKHKSKKERIAKALKIIRQYSLIDGEHHKNWVIVKITKALTGEKYQQFITQFDEHPDDMDGTISNQWNNMLEENCIPP